MKEKEFIDSEIGELDWTFRELETLKNKWIKTPWTCRYIKFLENAIKFKTDYINKLKEQIK